MVNLIQPITVQQAYDGITHTRWWASWNWWWRMVDDDDGNGFPSLEPRTDSRLALPREFRAWQRLRIVKRDESFSLIFSPWTWIYGVGVEIGGAPGGPRGSGHAQGVGCTPTLVDRVWAPWSWFFRQYFLLIPNNFRGVSGHSENFYFCTKIAPWQFCWKQRQPGLGAFKTWKLESKTRTKVFGKVDTMETYQLPQD